jgi:signal peptidase I
MTPLGDPTSDENPGMETHATRRVRAVLAFLANLLGLGLGYVYVGELRLAIVALVATCSALAFFAWTRLIVSTAIVYWIASGFMLVIVGTIFIHPTLFAVRNPYRAFKKYNRWWVYVLWFAGSLALGSIYIAHRNDWFGYGTYRIPSESMSPTLQRGDYFTVDTWRYRGHSPSVGDVIVYVKPNQPGVDFVRRVVAVSGDRIEGRDSILFRNGQPVAEKYLHGLDAGVGYDRNFSLIFIAPGEVFVLGDYRDNSLDSRAEGPVALNRIRGRAEFIWFSFAEGRIKWNRISTSLRPISEKLAAR